MVGSWRMIAGATSCGVVALIGALALWRRMKRVGPPTEWHKVGTLRDLRLYPVKSGQVIELDTALTTTLGLVEIKKDGDNSLPLRDRCLVIYQEGSGLFVSGKSHSGAVKLSVRADGEHGLELSYPEQQKFKLQLPKGQQAKAQATFIELYQKEKIPAIDCGEEVAKWLSMVITGKESGLRLGYWSEDITTRRDFTKSKLMQFYKKYRNEYTGAYSDLSSFHLVNISSVNDLQTKIGENGDSIGFERFRPNFVVEGAPPYVEDKWDWIRIGEKAIFRNYKPCTRCSLTTMNQDTGVKHPEQEPLNTLRKYRQIEDPVQRKAEKYSPVMGIYIGLYEAGVIKLGDPVYTA